MWSVMSSTNHTITWRKHCYKNKYTSFFIQSEGKQHGPTKHAHKPFPRTLAFVPDQEECFAHDIKDLSLIYNQPDLNTDKKDFFFPHLKLKQLKCSFFFLLGGGAVFIFLWAQRIHYLGTRKHSTVSLAWQYKLHVSSNLTWMFKHKVWFYSQIHAKSSMSNQDGKKFRVDSLTTPKPMHFQKWFSNSGQQKSKDNAPV